MIAVDTKLLVYSHREDSQFHPVAKAAVEGLRQQAAPRAVPWPCVHEFLAIVTHARIFNPPSTLKEACKQVAAWLESPVLVMLGEDEGYWPVLERALSKAKLSGPKVHDARIAALCLHHGVKELWSADRDFEQFPTLSTRNPLLHENDKH